MNWTMNKKLKSVVFRVRKQYFDAIISGEKTVEYRKDSSFWLRRLAPNPKPDVAVFLCGKRVHRRRITYITRSLTPYDFSEQGKKDVPTRFCWAIRLGEEVLA